MHEKNTWSTCYIGYVSLATPYLSQVKSIMKYLFKYGNELLKYFILI